MEKKNEEELIDLDWFKDAAELVDLVQSRCWGLYAEKLKRIIAEAERRKEIEVLGDMKKKVNGAILRGISPFCEGNNKALMQIDSFINSRLASLESPDQKHLSNVSGGEGAKRVLNSLEVKE